MQRKAGVRMKPLTWNELAEWYDKHIGGRKARTLPFDTVFSACAARKDVFVVLDDGGIAFKVQS